MFVVVVAPLFRNVELAIAEAVEKNPVLIMLAVMMIPLLKQD